MLENRIHKYRIHVHTHPLNGTRLCRTHEALKGLKLHYACFLCALVDWNQTPVMCSRVAPTAATTAARPKNQAENPQPCDVTMREEKSSSRSLHTPNNQNRQPTELTRDPCPYMRLSSSGRRKGGLAEVPMASEWSMGVRLMPN